MGALLLDAEPLLGELYSLLKGDRILQLCLVLCEPLQMNYEYSRQHHQLSLDIGLCLFAAGWTSVLILCIETLILEEISHAVHQIYWLGLLRLRPLVNKVSLHFDRFDAMGPLTMAQRRTVRCFDILQG